MQSWNLGKQRLKPAAWLQIKVDSLADLSHLLRVSCAMDQEAGDPADRDCLAIVVKELLSFAGSLGQQYTFD